MGMEKIVEVPQVQTVEKIVQAPAPVVPMPAPVVETIAPMPMPMPMTTMAAPMPISMPMTTMAAPMVETISPVMSAGYSAPVTTMGTTTMGAGYGLSPTIL